MGSTRTGLRPGPFLCDAYDSTRRWYPAELDEVVLWEAQRSRCASVEVAFRRRLRGGGGMWPWASSFSLRRCRKQIPCEIEPRPVPRSPGLHQAHTGTAKENSV
jgi:hypothetical protein